MNPDDVEILLLRPVDVQVDEESQRTFNAVHAARIAGEYEPALFGLGVVSLRDDGLYYCLDGQHRCAGAKTAGKGAERVPFQVYRGLTKAQEAELFLKLNSNKLKVDALSSFRVGVVAGNPVNVGIQRIIDGLGLRIAGYHSDGAIAAVGTLIQVYQQRGVFRCKEDVKGLPQGHLLSRTLSLLIKAWGRNRDAFDGLLMKGIASVIAKHGTVLDTDRLSRILKKSCDPVRATGQIRSLQSISKRNSAAAAMEYFVGVYNRGLSEGKKLA